MRQGSTLGPLLILALYYKVNYFANDTNLMNCQVSIKRIKRQINYDLKNSSDWVNANKIALNVKNRACYVYVWSLMVQKQPPRVVRKKRSSENMQQIYRRTPMLKCDFNKVAKQLYWNHTSTWVFSCKLAAYFQNTFPRKTSGWLLLMAKSFIRLFQSNN